MSRRFELALATGFEYFIKGDMASARAELTRALRMKPWDDPDLLDVHRRLGDIHYQWSGNTKEELELAERHYVQFLRQAKDLMDSPALSVNVRQAHPHARTPERAIFEEYIGKLAGVYMGLGMSVDRADKKARGLGRSGPWDAATDWFLRRKVAG